MLPYVHLFGKFDLPLYGPIFVTAAIIVTIIVRSMASKYQVAKEDVTFSTVYGMMGLAVGAKVFFFFSRVPDIVMNFDKALKVIKLDFIAFMNYAFGGWVFYGGLIGFVAGMYVYCRLYKVDFVRIIDLDTPFLPLVHGFGRIGCFMAGCCYGIEYHGPLAVHFPYNKIVPQLNEVPRFPVQLTEAFCNFIMFGILFMLMRKGKFRQGKLLGIYLIYYVVMRFSLEFLRGDIARGKWGALSTSQLVSLVLLPIAILVIRKGIQVKTIENK